MNVAHNLETMARYFPDHVAVIEGNSRLTYKQMNDAADQVASGLRAAGIQPGDHVALCAPNSSDWLQVYFGTLKCGAVAATLSSQLSEQEFTGLMGHTHPRALFCDDDRLGQVAAPDGGGTKPLVIAPSGDTTLKALMADGLAPEGTVDRDHSDTACILFTGGTTGLPKGVMLTHENINTAVANVARMERSNENDRSLCFLPFNHVFGQMHIMNASILTGGGLVLLPRFDMDEVLKAIQDHEVTKLFAVPTVYVRLLQLDRLKERLGKVRYCFSAAASMAREMVLQWKERAGLNIHEAYGMTETASIVTYNHYYSHRVGSVGTSVGTTEVSIRDEQGRPVPQGAEGEICVRGRNIMKGYLDNPEATKQAFWGEWLRSGDIGQQDEEGYLYIVDRLKDMVITGGENVYPREVEEILYQREEVTECAVIGLPDAEYGERVVAYMVLKAGAAADPDELKAFCKARMSPFKVPKAFVAMDALPTNAAGKILKRELRRAVMESDKE